MEYTGLYRGVVVNRDDPEGMTRIRMHIPQLMGDSISGWAYPVPSTTTIAPKVGEQVWAAFEGGDLAFPLYYAASAGGGFTVSDTAPAPAAVANGWRWFSTTTGVLYTYVNDGTSTQWVEM